MKLFPNLAFHEAVQTRDEDDERGYAECVEPYRCEWIGSEDMVHVAGMLQSRLCGV